MKQLGSMDFAKLLALRKKVEAALSVRIEEERKRLTKSLRELDTVVQPGTGKQQSRAANGHRKSKRIAIKYRNPENRKET
jgi:hypothetical protein